MDASRKTDIDQAKRFLSTLDPTADCRSFIDGTTDGFTFQTFDDDKERKSKSLARIINGTLDDNFSTLTSLNASRAGVFVTINETDMLGRKISNLSRVRAVWVEDDDGLGIPLPLEPHLVTETSPDKYHKLFLVSGLTFDQHQLVQNVLVNQYGSDKNAKDLARVLRVPGFFHNKGEPFMVKLIHESGEKPYTAEQILEAFEPDPAFTQPVSAPRSLSVPTAREEEPGYTPITVNEPLPDINASNAAKYLPEPGEQSYSEWRDVGMILHHQFEGREEGLIIFDEWSQKVRNYQGFEDVLNSWNSFGKRTSGNDLTFKSLVQAYNRKQAHNKKDLAISAADKGMKLIESCNDYMLLIQDVAPKAHRLADKNVILESDFADGILKAYATLRPGHTITRRDVIKAMKVRREKPVRNMDPMALLENPDTPEWARGWVWVSEDEVFFNIHSRACLSTRGFRGHMDSNIHTGAGEAVDAATYLRNNNLIPKVMRSMYAPGYDQLYTIEGVDYVNSYNAAFRCRVPDVIENQEAVDTFRRHLELTCGGWNRESQILANFFTLCTLPTPQKIRWALVLIGVEGSGKGVLYDFVSLALGTANTRVVSCSTIVASASDGKSGWAEGHCFGMIDEMKMHGHNRFDAINNLKPYITNDIVPCRQLFRETRNIINPANYFIPTNYSNALPISDGDRRYTFIESKVSPDKLDDDYFQKLFAAVREHTGSILVWLRSVPLHPDFKPDGVAPMTDTKREVIELSGDDFNALVKEVLVDDESYEYGKDVVLFDPLYQRMLIASKVPEKNMTYTLKNALTTMGFKPLGRHRVEGERHSLWMKSVDGEKPTAEAAKAIIKERKAKAIAKGEEIV